MQRHDIYGPIHKGLRLGLATTLVKIGETDFSSDEPAQKTLRAVREQVALSAAHLAHEEQHIHPALAERSSGATEGLDQDHRHHRLRLRQIEALVESIEGSADGVRPNLGRELYLLFSEFVAEDLVHMAEEELATLPLLHELFTDEELILMEGSIAASLPPQRMAEFMKLMVPAMNGPERLRFLQFVKSGTPAGAFNGLLCEIVRPALTPENYRSLERALEQGKSSTALAA